MREATQSWTLMALLAVVALVSVPAASGAPWSQAGYDAARTGHLPGPGPVTDDVAVTVDLPWRLAVNPLVGAPAGPLIVDATAYLPVLPDPDDNRFDDQGIVRIDLNTAEVELLVDMDTPPHPPAIAGDRIIVPRDAGVDAYDLATGQRLWSAEHPAYEVAHEATACMEPAVHDGVVVLPCTEFGSAGGQPHLTPFVWAVRTEDGATAWHQTLESSQEATRPGQAPSPEAIPPFFAGTMGVSLVGEHVLALTFEQNVAEGGCPGYSLAETGPCYYMANARVALWALGAGSGEIAWRNATTTSYEVAAGAYAAGMGTYQPLRDDAFPPTAPLFAGGERIGYGKLGGKLVAINPARGPAPVWEQGLGESDTVAEAMGTNSALADGALFVASPQTLYRFEVGGPETTWRLPLAETTETTTWGSLIVADGVLYAMGSTDDYTALYALDAESSDQLWRRELVTRGEGDGWGFHSYAVGEGVLVAAGKDGRVHVLGRTAASLQPVLNVTDSTPAVAASTEVDLTGTRPGVHGPATSFRADWGDGNTTGWQPQGVLNHSYAQEGPVTARFWVKNGANQTASITHRFDVGATEPTFLQTAFSPDYQDITFGVIGILVAVTGGAVGVARRYRGRSRLQEELDAIQELFEQTRDRPNECEAQLTERKAHARGLLTDGYLAEEQFSVVERRIEELRGRLRVSMLDERFAFLPHGMVQTLERMLEDGRINAWERETFLAALDEQDVLTEEQKGKVERLIGQWMDG